MKIKKHKNGVYYAHLTGGIEISLKTKSKTAAGVLAAGARLGEIEQAKKLNLLTAEAVTRLTSGGKVTAAQAREAWTTWAETVGLAPNTINRYGSDIDGFIQSYDGVRQSLGKATDVHVDAFVNPPGELSASTRRNRLSALQSFFAVAVAKGYVVLDPSRLVRVKLGDLSLVQKEGRTREPFTDVELALLRTVDDSFWKTFILLGENFGLRISDVAQLERESIRPGMLLVWTDKRDKRLEMPMSPDVEAHLRALPVLDERYVFPHQAELAGDPKRRSTLPTYFARLLGRLNIKDKNTHNLRHTFATKRRGLGDTIDDIRSKMGHSHTGTTEGYIHERITPQQVQRPQVHVSSNR